MHDDPSKNAVGGTLPIAEEVVTVDKRIVDRGSVRVSTTVEKIDEPVRATLFEQSAVVDRVRVDRIVETMPETRQDGDTIIVPIVEERLVLTKQLVVTEEVRIKLTEAVRTEEHDVTLRKERLTIDEIPPTSSRQSQIPSVDAKGDITVRDDSGDTPAHP